MPFDMINFTIAAPLLALAAGTGAILILDLLLTARQSHAWWFIAAVGSVLVAAYYMLPLWGTEMTGFHGAMVIDQLALVFTGILLVTTLLAILLSMGRSEVDTSGYLALLLWAAMGMIIIASAGNLLTIFVGIELLSLALYVKVAFDSKRPVAREAALKYFVLGSVASAFLLFGFALIYGVVGSMQLSEIAGYLDQMGAASTSGSAHLMPLYYKAGLGMALVGFTFKLALVPFHAWAPDVYEGAPTAVTAFMSVGTKAAAFAAMARFLMAVTPGSMQGSVLLPLSVLAAASMILGATVGMWQGDLKRLMAYSGIANAGYLIMAIPGLSGGGLSAAAYYMAAYMFAAMGVFAIIILLENEGQEGSKLGTFAGLYYRRPGLAFAMAFCMFGLAGLPPTGAFIGKFLLARAAVMSDSWLLLGALVLSTGISAYVYLRVIGTMFREGAQIKVRPVMAGAQGVEEVTFSPEVTRFGALAVLVIALVGLLWLGVLPGGAMEWLRVTVAG